MLFRPMLPESPDVLMTGQVIAMEADHVSLNPSAEHLACFAGGMFALGGRWLKNSTHLDVGRKLTDGCIWAYSHCPLGIMPEGFTMIACPDVADCPWNETLWRDNIAGRYDTPSSDFGIVNRVVERPELPAGFTSITNRHYILRPEAIESVFVMYRISGEAKYLDAAWRMFLAIQDHTMTGVANAAILDVTNPSAPLMDQMESFWLAETLKYFYLIFSDPSLISLDDYVFNTEAHPFRRPRGQRWWWMTPSNKRT